MGKDLKILPAQGLYKVSLEKLKIKMRVSNLILEEALKRISFLIGQRMEQLLPRPQEFNDSNLVAAMNYSALSNGKRIRPFLTIIAANLFKIEPEEILDIAVAIELIHVYSLIHDDLPAMDNDDYRRGQLSCHKKFDEATAILAGDALLTYAFEILSSPTTHRDAYVRCELINLITKAIGFNGMAGGQMIDIEANNKILGVEQIARLQRLKTSKMFMAAIEVGAILGRAQPEPRRALIRYAHDLGLAFQIKDDILDYQQRTENENKNEINNEINIGDNNLTDKKPHHNYQSNIVRVSGIENTKTQLELLHRQAIIHLKPFGFKANLFKELAGFIVNRNS